MSYVVSHLSPPVSTFVSKKWWQVIQYVIFLYYLQWHATCGNWKIHFIRKKMQQIKTWHVMSLFTWHVMSLFTWHVMSLFTSHKYCTTNMSHVISHLSPPFKLMCGGNTDKWFSMSLLCITCSDMQQVTYDISHPVIERNTVQDKWHNKSKLWFCNTTCHFLLVTCITHV